MNSLVLFLFCHYIFVNSYYIKNEKNHNITSLNNFIFGSCYNGDNSHNSRFEIFDIMEKHDPNLFIWTGDAAYIRYKSNKIRYRDKLWNFFFNRYGEYNSSKVEKKFNKTKYGKYYENFSKKYPIIGTWDDNDYAQNDGNKYFKFKEKIKSDYLNFLDEPENSIRRRPGRGIYETYSFGDINTHKSVRIILLDVRYDKTSIYENNRDILGNSHY